MIGNFQILVNKIYSPNSRQKLDRSGKTTGENFGPGEILVRLRISRFTKVLKN